MTALYVLYGLFLVVLLLKCIIMHKEIEDIREMMLQVKTDAYEDAKTQLDLLSKHVDGHSDLLHIFDGLRTRVNELEELVDTLSERYYESQRIQSNDPVNLMDLPIEETRVICIDDDRYDSQGKKLEQKEDEPCE